MLNRRSLLASAPLSMAMSSSGACAQAASAGEVVPWSLGTEKPTLVLPPGATDCIHHIFDDRFAVRPGTATPANATAADYLKLRHRLGLSRNIAVQPSNYGLDNSCILDAVKTFGPSSRGIAVVNADVTDAELRRLDAGGIRGVRFNFAPVSVTTPEMMKPLSKRFAALGWHIQYHALPEQTLAIADLLLDLDCPVVFDHYARIPATGGTEHPVFALVLRLLAQGKAWVKLSGVYNVSKDGAPDYGDVGSLVQAFVKAAPDRMLWGTGWPHTSLPANAKQNDAHALDLFGKWVPDVAVRNRIFVDNPARLYGFA